MNKFLLTSQIIGKYQSKTILVTGSQGFIGSTLALSLLDVDCKLILLDQSPKLPELFQNQSAEVSFFKGDVSKRQTWESVLGEVDYLFHLAALEYHRSKYDIMRDLQVNALSVFHLLEVCREKNFNLKIIFSSSANLFGLVEAWPVNEKNRDSPPSLWSAHKLLAENYIRFYTSQYGIKSVILRLANVYGPTVQQDAITHVVINKMIAKALRCGSLTLYSNHNCLRDYIFIDDVVCAFLYAGVENSLPSKGDFYIIGSEEEKTIKEVWQLIADKVKTYTGKEVNINIDDSMKLEPIDMRNFVSDSYAFRKATGWKPQVSIEQGIEITVKALSSLI